ncbi:MAG: hypothetical protein WBZ33_06305, partial [Thermoactinomyces sp.]
MSKVTFRVTTLTLAPSMLASRIETISRVALDSPEQMGVFGLTDVVQEAVTVGVVGQPAPAGTVKVKFPMSSETN